MTSATIRRLLAALVGLSLLAAACGDDDDTAVDDASATTEDTGDAGEEGSDAPTSGTLRVPDDYETIQAAVDAAEAGSLILIAPGTYNEAVDVTTDELVIRGLDRNEVILDGEFELENGVRVLEADGVVVENLTVRNYTRNGLFWTHTDGYRASYVTADRNGDYGIYAFGSVNGVFEHSYGAGSPDAGFYIGQCYPCNAVVADVLAEHNGLGYSGTNAGGDLYIVRSEWRLNRAGIVPNSGSYEGCAPERETTIVGNLVHDNNNGDTPAISSARLAQGNGILITGGIANVVERNRVWNHDIAGIGVTPFPEDDPIAPIPDEHPTDCTADAQPVDEEARAQLDNPLLWMGNDNRVVGNVVTDSREWDLVQILGEGNCWSGNEVAVTSPAELQSLAPCDGEIQPLETDVARFLELVEADKPESADYQTHEYPAIGDLPGMDDPENAPAEPQVGPPSYPDVAGIPVPDAPA